MTLKAQSTREQIDELGFHQNKKTPALQKTLLREWKDKPQTGIKIFTKSVPDKDSYPGNKKKSQNSTIMKQLKMGKYLWVLHQRRYVDSK